MMDTPNDTSEGLAPSSDTNMVLFTLLTPLIRIRSHPRTNDRHFMSSPATKDASADSSTAANPSSTTNTADSQHPGGFSVAAVYLIGEELTQAIRNSTIALCKIELTELQQDQLRSLRSLVGQMDESITALVRIKADTAEGFSNVNQCTKAKLEDLKKRLYDYIQEMKDLESQIDKRKRIAKEMQDVAKKSLL
ncbi:AEX-3 domain-containing protein [Colletotrichum sp. SAR 10_70]|nr:AEX-3 domain-containing protein [Colletotrichum sp. SAR 10_71]KAI8191267.1 AEX-3 domain-containing protein [Colletotrichum sp. SAR 10_70]